MNVIGNGVVIDPVTLRKEIENLNAKGVDVNKRLFISKKAHLILPTHKILDAASEAAKGVEKLVLHCVVFLPLTWIKQVVTVCALAILFHRLLKLFTIA